MGAIRMIGSVTLAARCGLLPVLAAALVFACAAPPRAPKAPQKPPETVKPAPKAAKPALGWETRTFDRKIGSCGEPRPDCVQVTLTYPVSPREEATPADEAVSWFVEKHLLAPVASDIRPPDPETLAAELFHAYEQVKADLKEYKSLWYLNREVAVIFADDRVVSLRFSEDLYTGGAHPNAFKKYRSFDTDTGRPLGLEDLVVPGRLGELTAIAGQIFREMYDIAPGVSLTDAGFWFETGRFQLNGNFAIVDRELVFYYNLYEITSYARGPTTLRIPLSDLEGILKARWRN